jgi:hypothetical protein
LKCPICNCDTVPAGSIDRNRTCEDFRHGSMIFPRAGHDVEYERCLGCGFVFAPELCAHPPEWFREHVYNDDYIKADPDYAETRPAQNARWIASQFAGVKAKIRHLDYGGGNGELAALMRGFGFDSESWDPFIDDPMPESRKYNLVTAFEVVEHVPDPKALRANLMRHMGNDSALLFSTLTSDHVGNHWTPREWWYAAPRNGHVCLYTKTALRKLFHPLRVFHMGEGVHMAVASLPSWLEASLQ